MRSSFVTRRPADFMHTGYAFIKEPLNLCQAGRTWLAGIYDHECNGARQDALVLGATPWIAKLLRRDHRRVVLVDASAEMLRMARRELSGDQAIELVQADWSTIPLRAELIDSVIADNSFSFVPFPEAWIGLCDELETRMRSGGRLLIRVCSVPAGHRSSSVDEIVEQFMAHESINYTEVRATLLFSQWDNATYAIRTEAALAEFEANRASFERLFARFPILPDNDLVTVTKYRGSGAIYYAPPLPEILKVIGRTFRVRSVHFGPYVMSQYFPLLVASKD